MIYHVGRRQHRHTWGLKFIPLMLPLGICLLVTGLVYANTRMNIGTPGAGVFGGAKTTRKHSQTPKQTPKSGSAHGSVAKSEMLSSPIGSGALAAADCTGGDAIHVGLGAAASPQLRKLAQYEQLCGGAVIDRVSFFVPTPSSPAQAKSYAADTASQLKEFARFGIKPLVFMEPNDENGLLDLQQYQAGAYDAALDTYYARLQGLGISDASMGMWVILPEGNLPEWGSVDPNVYAAVVTRTAQLQKKYFPGSQVSLMLDSETYPSANSWSGGAYTSLVPYVQNIPKGLIDSFGLQGFPWAAPAYQIGSVYDPTVYLRTDLAMQVAHALGTNNLWVNTGSFHQMYAGQNGRTVSLSPQQRQAMLNGVLEQLLTIQAAGFDVSLHLFAENKANTSEGTDWSYWQTTPGEDPNTAVLTNLVHDSRAAGIPLWLYDSE